MSLGGKFAALDGSDLEYSELTLNNDKGLFAMMDHDKF
jgi:hypothetical protein